MTPETQRFIELLQRQLGYADKGSSTKFGEWYGSNVEFDADYSSAPWCDMYISWAAHKLGYQAWVGQFAWTVAHAKWFKEQHAWGKVPTPGALVFFDWSGSGKIDDIDHVGVVTKVRGDTIFTIEGNTDGGVVESKERSTSSVVGYGYPERVKADLDATKSVLQLVQARPGPEAPQQAAGDWSAEARPGSQTRQDQYADQTSEASRDIHENQEQPGHRPTGSRPDADTTTNKPSDRVPRQPSGDHTGQAQPSSGHTGQEQPSGDKTVQSPHDQNPQATDDHAAPSGARPGADDPGRNTADGPGTHATDEPGPATADGPGTGAADGSHSQGQSADPVSPGDTQDDPHSATAPEHTQASDSPPNATTPTRDPADIPPATVAPAPSSSDNPSASPTSDTPSTTPTSDTPASTPTSDTPTATVTPTSDTPSATATAIPTPTASETPPTASATPTADAPSATPSTTPSTTATATASASVPQTASETTPSPTATTAAAEPTASPEPEPTASPTESAATSQSEPTATPTPATAPFSAEPVPEESTPAAPKAADTPVATAFPTHLQASVSGPLPSLSTPALVTSAVVTVVVLFAVFVVLKTRAGARSAATAAAGYAPPSPPVPVGPRHGVAEPDEGTVWRWELLEAIEAAVALDTTPPGEQDSTPSQQENRRPDPALGPQEDDALTEPLESIVNPGPLESTVDTGPIEHIVIPAATSPFNAFTPAESTDENVPDPARNGRSDQHAGDEDVTGGKTPPASDAL
ncbi:CHAP domain-containing protein [Nonomuraea sp. NPDC003709]|uniref:CHAP domain-containing protein n=1 Tax=Nonomuraea sp. NPDC003709 TaxID=3154450 RepID=UPI0033B854AE